MKQATIKWNQKAPKKKIKQPIEFKKKKNQFCNNSKIKTAFIKTEIILFSSTVYNEMNKTETKEFSDHKNLAFSPSCERFNLTMLMLILNS